jgi:hypothetical protein
LITSPWRSGLLSDNGSSYVAGGLAKWLEDKGMEHVRGAPYHPQTQGKIERWHQTLKNRILLENYYLPGDLEQQIDAFVERYNHVRYHESLNNLTPADVYFGRAETILVERERIKRNHRKPPLAASAAGRLHSNPDEPEPPFSKRLTSLKLSDDGQIGQQMRTASRLIPPNFCYFSLHFQLCAWHLYRLNRISSLRHQASAGLQNAMYSGRLPAEL